MESPDQVTVPAIVTAGDGSAARAVYGQSKVYLELGGEPLVVHVVRALQAAPEIEKAMRGVLQHSECRDETRYRSLEGLGLVRRDGSRVTPRCRLYRDFLRVRL